MKKQNIGFTVFIILLIIIAYRQVVFLMHPLMWDTPAAFFPFRYYLVECLRNAHLPLWTPYPSSGYPFFADPQSGAWYPIAWLFACFGQYTIATSNIEYALHICIGALGMYKLASQWAQDRNGAFIAAIAYAACGLFVGNAEHLSWVISAAWLPWMFFTYYRLLQTASLQYAAYFALIIFMMLSGGYPAFLIISIYILLIIFLVSLFRRTRLQPLGTLLRLHAILLGLCLACGAIVIFSYLSAAGISTRGSGISLQRALVSPFSAHSFLSFIWPFGSFKDNAFYATDPSMSNGYFGIISFALFLLALTLKKDRASWLVIALSFFCMAAALGNVLPVRAFLYRYIPLMNLFRFPAVFRVFFIIGFLLLAATAFQQLKGNFAGLHKRFVCIIVLLSLLCIIMMLYSWQLHSADFVSWLLLWQRRNIAEQHISPYQHLFAQSAIQLVFMISLLLWLIFSKSDKPRLGFILLLCSLDMIVSVQLNIYGTVINKDLAIKEVKQHFNNCPQGFPLPDNTIAIAEHNDGRYAAELDPVGGNTLLFKKEIGINGYNPFILRLYDSLDRSSVKDAVWSNPPAYFAANILTWAAGTKPVNKNDVFLDDVGLQLNNKCEPAAPGDSVYFTAFAPNEMTLHTHASGPRWFVLQQNNVSHWHLKVDDKPAKWYNTNIAYMGMPIPAGDHTLHFSFHPPYIKWMLACSLLGISTCLLIIFLSLKRKTWNSAE